MRQGGCLCGAVRFTVTGEARPVIFCHCSQCRRQSGLYVAATSVSDDRLTVSGETLRWYASSEDARRGFCSICGSLLFWKHRSLPHTSIMAGAFDQASGLDPSHHIFTADKGDFYVIKDGLPQFAQGDGKTATAGPSEAE